MNCQYEKSHIKKYINMIKQFLCIGLLILVIHSSYSHNVNTNTAGSCIDLHCVVCKSSNATCDQC